MAKRILISNRGEIAIRIMKAIRALGWESVAVFSEPDKESYHLNFADFKAPLGGEKALESYLNIEKIIKVAKKYKVDGIHPGYGFLAENPDFAKRVLGEGFVFIGPKPENIKLLGDKLEARERISKAGVPITPGSKEPITLEKAKALAKQIGLPILIKAAAGGGGKGMKIVQKEEELEQALESASREAKSAFGDERVYIEKYLENPRHIEFQILADKYGKVLHFYERECSIQRRYQKIIEETPSLALNEDLREKMAKAAIEVAKVVSYENAGTVEFLFSEGNFYFLEVNTRIQVEHPITELTTGYDLVQLQLKIAFGEPLEIEQNEIKPKGHSIECRIYAENPLQNFLPSPGKIYFVKEPNLNWVRVDSGIISGQVVPQHYDPILSKVITYGKDREEARKLMVKALKDYVILGVYTPIPFLIDILEHPAFIEGKINTHFIPDYFSDFKPHSNLEEQRKVFSIATLLFSKLGAKLEKEKFVEGSPKRVWDLLPQFGREVLK